MPISPEEICRKLGESKTKAIFAELTSRSEEHTSELQSLAYLVCRLPLDKEQSSLEDPYVGTIRSCRAFLSALHGVIDGLIRHLIECGDRAVISSPKLIATHTAIFVDLRA